MKRFLHSCSTLTLMDLLLGSSFAWSLESPNTYGVTTGTTTTVWHYTPPATLPPTSFFRKLGRVVEICMEVISGTLFRPLTASKPDSKT